MSDATNDTTRTEQSLTLRLAACHLAAKILQDTLNLRDADLLRLAGPICDHTPCKGARAIEHNLIPGAERGAGPDMCAGEREKPWRKCGTIANHEIIVGMGQQQHEWSPVARKHPPSPAIEAWLLARSAK